MPNGGYPLHLLIKPANPEILLHADGDTLAIKSVGYREDGDWYADMLIAQFPRAASERLVAHLIRWMAIWDNRQSDMPTLVEELLSARPFIEPRDVDDCEIAYNV